MPLAGVGGSLEGWADEPFLRVGSCLEQKEGQLGMKEVLLTLDLLLGQQCPQMSEVRRVGLKALAPVSWVDVKLRLWTLRSPSAELAPGERSLALRSPPPSSPKRPPGHRKTSDPPAASVLVCWTKVVAGWWWCWVSSW